MIDETEDDKPDDDAGKKETDEKPGTIYSPSAPGGSEAGG